MFIALHNNFGDGPCVGTANADMVVRLFSSFGLSGVCFLSFHCAPINVFFWGEYLGGDGVTRTHWGGWGWGFGGCGDPAMVGNITHRWGNQTTPQGVIENSDS